MRLSLLFLVLSLPAFADWGTVCSVARGTHWAVGVSNDGSSDSCKIAFEELKNKLINSGEEWNVSPALEIYMQGYFDSEGQNTATLSCDHNGVGKDQSFQARGALPIHEAVAQGRRERGQCRVTIPDLTISANHPIGDKSMLGYCSYEDENGYRVTKLSSEGAGRRASCLGASEAMGNRKITRRSSGYYRAAGETRVQYQCLEGNDGYNTAYILGMEAMKSLRGKLEASGAKHCMIATNVFGDFDFNQGYEQVLPGFESVNGPSNPSTDPVMPPVVVVPPYDPGGDTPVDAPPAADVVAAVDANIDSFIQELNRIQVPADALVDLPDAEIDEQNGTASIQTPTLPAEQKNLADQRNAPLPTTPIGTVVDGRQSTINSSKNSKTYGSDLLGVKIGYDIHVASWNDISAVGYMEGRVFRNSQSIVSMTGRTSPAAVGNQNAVDVLVSVKALGQTHEVIRERLTGPKVKKAKGKNYIDQTIFESEQQFFVGPVPVNCKVKVTGKAGHTGPGYDLKAQVDDGALIGAKLILATYPYANVVAQGSAGIGVPVAKAGAMGEVDLLNGELYSHGIGELAQGANGPQSQACAKAGIGKLSMLDGKFSAFYTIKEPSTHYVTQVIGGMCKSVGRWGGVFRKVSQQCDKAVTQIKKVTKYTNLYHKKSFYKWKGIQVANEHPWFNSCSAGN